MPRTSSVSTIAPMNKLSDVAFVSAEKFSNIYIDNNNNDNLYGAVTQPCRYKGASQSTE